MVKLPCGSASTNRTFLPSIASPMPRFSQVVVLPVPPFWLTMAIVVAFFEIFITSYYKRVVFIDRSPAGCYNNYRVLWIGLYHLPSNGFAEAPTTASLLKC